MNGLFKQRAVAIARGLRILPMLDAMRFIRSKYQSTTSNASFRQEHPEFAPPPLWWMHDMYRHTSFELYWRTGTATAQRIQEKITHYVVSKNPVVADWGCGLGRVIRHLPAEYELHGFDYNESAIRWNGEMLPSINFHRNNLLPPLMVSDDTFDAMFALSVFTHLSEEAHISWIKEVGRVLKPGGIFLGAFHMRPDQAQLLPGEWARFEAGNLVTRGGVKEGSRTYTAHHPEAYLKNELFRDFEILEGPIDFFGQELFIVRKPKINEN